MAKILQLKRNATLYVGHAEALAALQTKLAAETYVGEPIIARYKTSADSNDERILLGIVGANGKYEIFDNDATSSAISDAIAALDAEITSADGTNVQVKVTEVDGKITGVNITTDNSINNTDLTNAINALDSSVSATAADGNKYSVLTGVTETDGKLTGKTEVKLAAVAKTGAAADVSTTDIAATSTNVSVTGATVPAQIQDLATTLKTVQDNAAKYKVVALSAAEIATLPDAVNVKDAYKVVSFVGAETAQTVYTQVGDTIKIYKDSSLVNFYLGHVDDALTNADAQGESVDTAVTTGTGSEALVYIMQLANGKYKLTAINVEDFLQEAEFKNGLQVVNHEVSVKKDSTSGKVTTSAGANQDVLTVSANGVKIANVQEAIDYATAQLGITAAGDEYVSAAVDANNNKKINVSADVQDVTATAGTPGTYNATTGAQTVAPVAGTLSGTSNSLVDGADVASKVKTYVDGAINIEKARADANVVAKIAALDVTDSAVSGEYVSQVSETDGKVSVTRASIGTAVIKGFTQDSSASGAIAATDTLAAALNKLENKADNGLDAVEAGNGISVSSKASKKQTITAVAVSNDPVIEVTANGIGTKANAIWDCGEY